MTRLTPASIAAAASSYVAKTCFRATMSLTPF
jgi:hypothetical protein